MRSLFSRGTALPLFWIVMHACGSGAGRAPPDAGAPDAPLANEPDGGVAAPSFPRPCGAIYAQEILPTFELEIDEAEWAALQDDHALREEREAAGLDPHPYHPLRSFRWGEHATGRAWIRLRGNSSWSESKLQFLISFNEGDPDGRFLGLRKIVLDAADTNRSFLGERLALAYLRDLGLAAPCANNARLVVNGAYYGLYTNLERVDREFLERNFADPDGDLYKYGRELVTNEETGGHPERLEQLRDAADLAEVEALADLDEVIEEWAAEATIPQADGYFVGRGNFYLYDDPARGFVWIPWDLDVAFDWAPVDLDPILYEASDDDKHATFALVLADPGGNARYLEALARTAAAYEAGALAARIDDWSAQIADAAAADPWKSFSTETHEQAVAALRAYVAERDRFLDAWLACRQDPGASVDADADGIPWCADCDEVSCQRN